MPRKQTGADILRATYGGLTIERWPAPVTAERITEEALRRRRPVIVTGLIEDWPALGTWSLDHFADAFGGLFTQGFGGGDESEARPIRLRRLVGRIRAGEALYSSFYVGDGLPLFREGYAIDDRVLGDPTLNWLLDLPPDLHGQMNVLFVGGRGAGIANHHDSMGTHLWSAQIHGRKRWWVAPPEMAPMVADGTAQWRHRERDIKRFPAFADAACLDFVLAPGEVLFLPEGWWHETELLDDSISITHDIVNATNHRAFAHELDTSHATDPKVAAFRDGAGPLRAGWRARLRPRSSQPIERSAGPIHFDRLMTDHLEPRRPVILQRQIDDWTALGTWTLDRFGERFGAFFVQAFQRRDDESKHVRLRRFLAESGGTPRYAMWCLDDCVTLLEDEFDRLPFLGDATQDWTLDLPATEQKALSWIFLGRAGSGIGCHNDRLGQHVASAQITGRKQWWLHPPTDAPWLYHGDVDLAEPDLRRHPLYENATPVLTGVLEPGEVLILPDGWWHQTLALDDSISLSHDFFNASNAEQFITRLEARRGLAFMETAEMRPILHGWRRRMARAAG